jgi:VIT1/CCC1 family predicted Fe2+/Mn2+ transporter
MLECHYKGIPPSVQPTQCERRDPNSPACRLDRAITDNGAMPLPSPPIRRHSNKANNDLLIKSGLCVLIGLAVLVSPYFITSPGMQGIVAGASLVGWFALVLGLAFGGLWLRRKLARSHGPARSQ